MAQAHRPKTDAPAPASPSGAASLTLYVEEGCRACSHALEVLGRVQQEFPELEISTIDLGRVSSGGSERGLRGADVCS